LRGLVANRQRGVGDPHSRVGKRFRLVA